MRNWKPLENNHGACSTPLFLAVLDKDDPTKRDVLFVHRGKVDQFFTNDGSWLTVNEQGWVPYAWCEADLPERDDAKFPPRRHDSMTKPESEQEI